VYLSFYARVERMININIGKIKVGSVNSLFIEYNDITLTLLYLGDLWHRNYKVASMFKVEKRENDNVDEYVILAKELTVSDVKEFIEKLNDYITVNDIDIDIAELKEKLNIMIRDARPVISREEMEKIEKLDKPILVSSIVLDK